MEEILQTSWYGEYSVFYRVLYMSGGDRRISEPSTVSQQDEWIATLNVT